MVGDPTITEGRWVVGERREIAFDGETHSEYWESVPVAEATAGNRSGERLGMHELVRYVNQLEKLIAKIVTASFKDGETNLSIENLKMITALLSGEES